ncbi:response regulator [Actomonas aquatica]|uniref:histidine kinase n=1 Tax=Actomonas aquatica TaxID=2866162 RepID=A0ABZ1CBI3_9BACT|nr:response regulator [Opitutus sp. WL0086]WRQ89038.1 response regulator [Opitutus sp. WL0086]
MPPEESPAKATVLIVDDTERSRVLLNSLLAPEGYKLIEAADGLEAIEQAQAHAPDVILLDVMMPGIDGFETCRLIREMEGLKEVPILILTALDDRKSRLEGLKAGADDFITKPIDTTELRIRLRTITRINRFRNLYEERARFEQAINHSPDGVIIANGEGNITLINPAARDLLSPEAPVNGKFCELLAPDAAEQLRTQMQQQKSTGRSSILTEFVYGRRIPNQVEITAAHLDGDSIIFNIRDITERQSLEAQLISMQRLEVLGQLAGGIAHDLNNILAAVMGTASLMELTSPEADKKHLKTILTSSRRGAEMLRQLLAFSRGSDTDIGAVDVTEVAREVADVASETFPAVIDVRFETPAEASLPDITANASQLHQIFMNLCVNARDALLPGGGTLTVTLGRRTIESVEGLTDSSGGKPGDYLTVAVSDTGTGIPPEVRPRLFEPFFSTKPQGRGTGLGLPTVARLVHLHHGFISLDSTVGQGTTFTCHFPLTPPASD